MTETAAPTMTKTTAEVDRVVRGTSPLRLALRNFRAHRHAVIGLWVLGLLYFLAIFADFIAPYHYDNQIRELQWTPPTRLRFSDANGFSWRPFIHPTRSYIDENFNIRQQTDPSIRCYMRWFVKGDVHYFLGFVPSRLHLFGFDDVAQVTTGDQYYSRFYLFGSDLSGRDIFSRICYGARISMTIGLVGATIVLFIGMLIGGISGYFGGMVDNILQRLCEMVMLLPGFYLLLMLRFMFPASMDSVKVYFAVVFILALVGWAGLARVIRGMVLSIRTEDYVQAARAIGVRPLGIIVKHVLPHTMTYAIVSFTLAIPSYILGEAALSLLGLGIMEPVPSWGNMLSKAMDISELKQHPWVLWPGVFIFITVLAFNLVGDGLRDALDPKLRKRE
jgi:peptide/nickel transport system permease protein